MNKHPLVKKMIDTSMEAAKDNFLKELKQNSKIETCLDREQKPNEMVELWDEMLEIDKK